MFVVLVVMCVGVVVCVWCVVCGCCWLSLVVFGVLCVVAGVGVAR